jgi:hypothetical protein
LAKGATPGCMICGSSEVTLFGTETREPIQNEALMKAAAREYCREILRGKVRLRRAVREGEISPEEIDGNDFWFPPSEPDWNEGVHLCPQCRSYGLHFSDITMFLD